MEGSTALSVRPDDVGFIAVPFGSGRDSMFEPPKTESMAEAVPQCHGRRVDHSTSGWMASCEEKSLFFVIGS